MGRIAAARALRTLLAVVAWLVAYGPGAAPAAAQAVPSPAEVATEAASPKPIDIEPLLPSERLFERDTWTDLGKRLLDRTEEALPRLLVNLLAATLVLLLFLLLSRAVSRVLLRLIARSRVDPALGQIAVPLVRYVILGLGIIMAAAQAGFQVGSLLAGVGIAGLAIGLAAQDSLGNIVAGFTILWDRPFRLGDRVTLAGGHYGTVTAIGLRSTRLRTLEQLDVILPNQEVINTTIVNHTLSPNLRLGVPLGIAYKEDTRRAREVLLAAVEGHPRIKKEPPPEVVVTALADSGVNLELRVWIKDPMEERQGLFAMLELAKLALDEAGIEIPFPQRTLHFHPSSPPFQWERAPDRPSADDDAPV